jgi:Ca2+-binding EF-hand superfamily protein
MLSRRAAIGYVATTVLLGFSRPALAARGASFQAIDSSGDGKLDLDEIKKAAAAKFDALDRNRTGTLTRREVGRLRLSRKDFAAADPDKDGTLSKDEYVAIVEQRFKAADTKKQGYLTLAEFNSRAALPLRRLIY